MREKREIIFLITGGLLSLAIISLIIYSVVFLSGKIEVAFDKKTPIEQPIVKFNLETLKKIGIGE